MLPNSSAAVASTASTRAPEPMLTVLFGTAEVAAESIAARLAGRFAVAVRDLADTDPADLAAGTLAVAVCSTYGDGELPTSARGFAERLAAGARLDGVRFAAFGLGDRTYGETYSRGADLLTAAFESAGAEHVLEVGRHDAATGRSASETAGEWAEGVAEELAGLVVVEG